MADKSNKLAIIMVGAPGSGKGTQGEILEKNTGFKRYVMSDLIKKELKPGTELHKRLFQEGALLDDVEIFNIFRKHFGSERQVIIDGLPRTLDQAYWLYGFLMRHKYEIELVFLDVDESKLIERITARRYCPKCHASYNLIYKKPENDNVCNIDGETLIQREDDTENVFGERLKTFDAVKEIILDVYKGEVLNVNGDQSIDEVSQEIMRDIILRD